MKQFMQQDSREFGLIGKKLGFEGHLAGPQIAGRVDRFTEARSGQEFAAGSGQLRQESQRDRVPLQNRKPGQRCKKTFTLRERPERWKGPGRP